MCKILEDMCNEAAEKAFIEATKKTAINMIKDGVLPLEKITEYLPSLSMDELKKLEAEMVQ